MQLSWLRPSVPSLKTGDVSLFDKNVAVKLDQPQNRKYFKNFNACWDNAFLYRQAFSFTSHALLLLKSKKTHYAIKLVIFIIRDLNYIIQATECTPKPERAVMRHRQLSESRRPKRKKRMEDHGNGALRCTSLKSVEQGIALASVGAFRASQPLEAQRELCTWVVLRKAADYDRGRKQSGKTTKKSRHSWLR